MFIMGGAVRRYMQDRSTASAWVQGFATGVAVCGLAIYAKRKYSERTPQLVRRDATVIPID